MAVCPPDKGVLHILYQATHISRFYAFRPFRSNVEITCSLEEREQEPMATDAIASDNYRERQKVTDSGHDIGECSMKRSV